MSKLQLSPLLSLVLLSGATLAGCSMSQPKQDFVPTPQGIVGYVLQAEGLDYTPERYLNWTDLAHENRSDLLEEAFHRADQNPSHQGAVSVNETEFNKTHDGLLREWTARFGEFHSTFYVFPMSYDTRYYNVTMSMVDN